MGQDNYTQNYSKDVSQPYWRWHLISSPQILLTRYKKEQHQEDRHNWKLKMEDQDPSTSYFFHIFKLNIYESWVMAFSLRFFGA